MSGSSYPTQADFDTLTQEVADLSTEVNTLKTQADAQAAELAQVQQQLAALQRPVASQDGGDPGLRALDPPGDLSGLDNWIRSQMPGTSLEYQLNFMCQQFYGLPLMPPT